MKLVTNHDSNTSMQVRDTIQKPVAYRTLHSETHNVDSDLWDGFPVHEVMTHYHTVGKHFVEPDLLNTLASVQEVVCEVSPPSETGTSHRTLFDTFLYMLLDKHHDLYNFPSYTGLSLVIDGTHPENASYEQHRSTRVYHIILLLLDTIRFECRTLLGTETRFSEMLAPGRQRKLRVYNALKAIQAYSRYTDASVWSDSMEELNCKMAHLVDIRAQKNHSDSLHQARTRLTSGTLIDTDVAFYLLKCIQIIRNKVNHGDFTGLDRRLVSGAYELLLPMVQRLLRG